MSKASGHPKPPKEDHPPEAAQIGGYEIIIKNVKAGEREDDQVLKVKRRIMRTRKGDGRNHLEKIADDGNCR